MDRQCVHRAVIICKMNMCNFKEIDALVISPAGTVNESKLSIIVYSVMPF